MGEDLRNTLIVSKDKTQYDMKAKKILARESVLSYILASTVDEFKGMDVEEVAKHIVGKVYVSKVPTGSGLTNYETENVNGDRIVFFNTEDFENDAYMGNYDWGGKLDLINIVLLGIPNKLPEKGEEYELHRLLSTLFSVELPPEERIDILQDEYNIAHEDAFRKELIELCNLSEGILEQGEVRGRTKEAKESAQRMYKKGYEISVIADLLNRTEQQIKIWLGLTPV